MAQEVPETPPGGTGGAELLGDFAAVLPLEGIGVVGIMLIGAWMLAKGILVIGATHREQMQERDARNAKTEGALDKALDVIADQQKTITHQMAMSDVAAHLLEELRKEGLARTE